MIDKQVGTRVRSARRWPAYSLATALTVGMMLPGSAAAQGSAVALDGDSTTRGSAARAAPRTAAAALAVIAEAGPEGFGVRTADGAFRLRFQGLAHYDARAFVDDDVESHVSGFDVRRVRADLRGTVYDDYDFRLNLDYAGNRVEVLDAYLEGRFSPAVQLRVGKFKAPVGLERLQSASATTFPERGFTTALVPNRDVGIQLQGAFGGSVLSYAIGLFNGVPDGGSGDTDVSNSKDLAGRLFLQPFARSNGSALRGLGLGIAAATGEQSGSAAAPGVPAFRTPIGRSTFLRFRSDGSPAGTAVLDGRRTRIAPQGYWYWGSVGALAEYVRSTSEVRLGDELDELNNQAWQVVGTWVLTGEAASYRGVVPARAFDPAAGSWGALELAGRLQSIETDASSFQLVANPAQSVLSATSFTAGINWYLNRVVKLQADYERTTFDAAAGGLELDAENVLVTRFQVAF